MSATLINFICSNCGINYSRTKSHCNKTLKRKSETTFCSQQCWGEYQSKISNQLVICKNCSKEFNKKISQINKTKGNNFCSQYCSGYYNNTHKTKGNRRSKVEIYIENQLKTIYPSLTILFNDKTIINSELDIYIPSLKLAFELNGIFHYEPIYGEKKLKSIQNNDNRKFQACLEQGIELCIIDTSRQIYFKEKTANQFLQIICNIINKRKV